MPASLLATLTGLLFLQGQDALGYGLGLMSGLVAATVLMASRLRTSRVQTVPAYLERRFGTTVAVLGAVVLGLVTLLLLVAELSFVGLAAERGLGHSYSASVVLAAVIVAAVVVLSVRARRHAPCRLFSMAFLLRVSRSRSYSSRGPLRALCCLKSHRGVCFRKSVLQNERCSRAGSRICARSVSTRSRSWIWTN